MNGLDLVLRNLVALGMLFLFALITGKKLVSQLNFFDYIVGVTIGSIAGVLVMDPKIPYSRGIISLLIWGLTPLVAARIALASIPIRRVLDGVPAVLLQNGRILENNLKREKLHVNDLLEELRLQGVFNINDVETAVLETNGQISVQLKSERQPVTPADLNLPTGYRGLSANLIIDGCILQQHLQLVNRDEAWLMAELQKRNIASPREVLLASLDTQGNLYIDLKTDGLVTRDVLK